MLNVAVALAEQVTEGERTEDEEVRKKNASGLIPYQAFRFYFECVESQSRISPLSLF